MARKKLYVTAYDTSFRYDMDSRWTTRLASIVQSFNGKESKNEQRQTENYQSLTQVFLSVVDCNFDYSSPQRFSTAARKILRIGDLRISSNVVTPYTSMQACTVSVGDVSFYLCNCRYPYNYENARLLGAKSILKQHQLLAPLGLFEDSDLDDIHRRMNYKIVATLDSIDAIITLSNAQDPIEANPPICINVTIGQLCVFACKDTLSRLTDSIGELSRVMTALSDDALSKLREKSDESRRLQGINKTELDRIKQKSSGMLKEYPLKSSGLLSHESSKNSFGHPDFLIDGYDWMTIDAEEKTHVHGEEQARWYNSDGDASFLAKDEHDAVVENSVGDTQKLFRFGNHIITHHFPLRPVSDPIGDGDMGLSKYAGIQTKPQVKCRLMVHDLSFRIRLFDGYDWPEMLDEVERGAPTCDAFVIPVAVSPPVSSEEETDQPTIIGRTIDVNPVDRKSQLMVDLLAGDPAHGSPFENIPLPGERKMTLKEQAEKRRLSRRTSKYFQFDISGVSVRLDSIEESTEHRIASCLNLKVQDLFLAETISSNRPVKLLGEWFNEQEHPRDFNDGLVMMKVNLKIELLAHSVCFNVANSLIGFGWDLY